MSSDVPMCLVFYLTRVSKVDVLTLYLDFVTLVLFIFTLKIHIILQADIRIFYRSDVYHQLLVLNILSYNNNICIKVNLFYFMLRRLVWRIWCYEPNRMN